MIEAVVNETTAFSNSPAAKKSLPCAYDECQTRCKGVKLMANGLETHLLLLLLRQIAAERRALCPRFRAELEQPTPRLQRPPLDRALLLALKQLDARPERIDDITATKAEGRLESPDAALPFEERAHVLGEDERVVEHEAVHRGVEGVGEGEEVVLDDVLAADALPFGTGETLRENK